MTHIGLSIEYDQKTGYSAGWSLSCTIQCGRIIYPSGVLFIQYTPCNIQPPPCPSFFSVVFCVGLPVLNLIFKKVSQEETSRLIYSWQSHRSTFWVRLIQRGDCKKNDLTSNRKPISPQFSKMYKVRYHYNVSGCSN